MGIRVFLLARFILVIAAQIQTIVTGWQVYEATHSTFNLGLVGLAVFLPYMFLMPLAGDASDRFNRGKIAGMSSIFLGLFIAAQGVWISHNPNKISGTIFILAGIGIVRAFGSAAHGSMIALLVPKEKLMKYITLNTAVWNASCVIGPVVGGFLYSEVGAVNTLWIASSGALLSSLVFLGLKVRTIEADNTESRVVRIMAGFRYIWREKEILGAISLDLFAVLFGGAMALLPVFAKDILHVGPDGFGLLRSATALGSIPTALWFAKRPIKKDPGRKLFFAVYVFGFAMIGFGLSRYFWLSFTFLALSGAADVVSVYIRHGLLQLRVSEEMRGRVTAVNQIFIGASNELGEFESGMAATLFGPVGAVVGGGFITILCVFLCKKLFPKLANLEQV
jgi:MFS family permease